MVLKVLSVELITESNIDGELVLAGGESIVTISRNVFTLLPLLLERCSLEKMVLTCRHHGYSTNNVGM